MPNYNLRSNNQSVVNRVPATTTRQSVLINAGDSLNHQQPPPPATASSAGEPANHQQPPPLATASSVGEPANQQVINLFTNQFQSLFTALQQASTRIASTPSATVTSATTSVNATHHVKYELTQELLNQGNYITWFKLVKVKLVDWQADALIDRDPVNEQERVLSNRVFAAIYSNISNEVRKSLQLKGETIKELHAALLRKFNPYTQQLRDTALKNLRSVYFSEQCDIMKFTENFQKQVNVVNSDGELLSDRATRAIFIQNFDNFPQYKTVLTQFESECKRNEREITLPDLLDYANVTINSKKRKKDSPDLDSYRYKRNDRYRNNRKVDNHKRYNSNQSDSDQSDSDQSDSRNQHQSRYQNHQKNQDHRLKSQHYQQNHQPQHQQNQQQSPHGKPNYRNNNPKYEKDNQKDFKDKRKNVASFESNSVSDSDDEPAMVKAMRRSVKSSIRN